jgi:hypothetical protein
MHVNHKIETNPLTNAVVARRVVFKKWIASGNHNHKCAFAGQVNRFTHLRALLVLYDRGV